MYIGVTNDLIRRVFEHKNKLSKGFTYKYHVDRLVYYEIYSDITDAIAREKKMKKKMKGWSRQKKNQLVNQCNPHWGDLYPTLL